MSTEPKVTNKQRLLSLVKSGEGVPRKHSLYDLEADELLKNNQANGKLSPEWKVSKYKICGSFVENKRGNGLKVGAANRRSSLRLTSADSQSSLKRTKRSTLNIEKHESYEQVQPVTNVDEVLKAKSSPNNNTPNLPTPALPSLLSTHPQSTPPQLQLPQISQSQNFGIDLSKRQSVLDFEKAINMNYGSYQNLLANQSIFNSFLSNSSGSFSNMVGLGLSKRNLHNQSQNLATLPTPENHFNVEHVREVNVVETDLPSVNLSQSHQLPQSTPQFYGRGIIRPRSYGIDLRHAPAKKRGKWSESEDRILQSLAQNFIKRKEKINFKKVADQLRGRSAKQCREHWLSTLNPNLKKGRWTKNEEIKLLDLMIENGKSWSIIAKDIEGRAEHSVKAKGRLMLGERLKTVPQNAVQYTGTDEQKKILLQLHTQLGSEFDEISKQSCLIISPAKIERTLLTLCKCANCTMLNEKIKATKTTNFLQGWTMVKSGMIKDSVMNKTQNYYLNDKIQSQAQVQAQSKLIRFNSFSKLSMYKDGEPN